MQETQSVTPTESSETSNEVESTESDSQESQSETEAPAKESKAAQIRRLSDGDLDAVVTVKVNGEVKELTVREVMKLNQLEKASQSKMQEASKLSQQAQEIFRLAKTNPKEFLRRTGIDPDEFAESTLAEKFELMKMSPEQKRLRDLEMKEKEWEKREKEEQQYKEKEKLSRLEAQELETLDKEFGQALLESGIKKPSKYTVAQIAARMLSASRQNIPLTAKEAAASVIKERRDSLLEELHDMDAKAIHDWLGKEALKKIRTYDVERVSGKSTPQNSQGPGAKPASTAKKTFKTEHEWREHISSMQAKLRD